MLFIIIAGISCSQKEKLITPTSPDEQLTTRTAKYSISTALDYLNDSLNVKYCRPGSEFGETLVFSDSIRVEVDANNEITESDLLNLMDSIAYYAGDRYYSVAGSNKAPFMFVIKQASNVVNDSIDFGAWFVMETDDPVLTEEYPYDDAWPYGFDDLIECNESQVDEDAADLFRRDLRRRNLYEPSPKSESYYFKDPYVVCFSPHFDECNSFEIPFMEKDAVIENVNLLNPDDETEGDNYYDFLLFSTRSTNPNDHQCLSAEEMNFYFESMEDLIQDQLTTIEVGSRVIGNIDVGYNLFPGGSFTVEFQTLMVTYVVKANRAVSFPVQVLPN